MATGFEQQVLDVSVRGGTTAYSLLSETATLELLPVNDLPTITGAPADTSIPKNGAFGLYYFQVGDIETPAASLQVSAASSNTALVPEANITLDGSGAMRSIVVTPTADQIGSTVITLTVLDADGGSTSASFTLTVEAVNGLPTISGSGLVDQSVGEGTTSVGPLSFTIGDAETQSDALVVAAVSSNPTLLPDSGIVLGGAGANRNITLTPAENESGNATVTVTVTDPDGGSTSTSFTLIVTPTNSQPVGQPQTVGTLRNTPITFMLGGLDGDREVEQTLTFALVPVSGPAQGTITSFDPATGSVTYEPNAGYVGGDSFQFTVTDDNSLQPGPLTSDPATVTIAVAEFDSPPVLRSIADPQTVAEQGTLFFRAVADDPDPSDSVSYAIDWYGRDAQTPQPLPGNASFNTATGIFRWTPGEADGPSDYHAVIRAMDNASEPLEDSQAVTVTVEETNLRPRIDGPGYPDYEWPKTPFTSFSDDDTSPKTVVFPISFSDADTPEQNLQISFPGNQTGLSFDPLSKQVSLVVSSDQAVSTLEVTIAVDDGAGGTDSVVVPILVGHSSRDRRCSPPRGTIPFRTFTARL